MSRQPSQRIFGLDVMRAAAVLLVVASHALLFLPKVRAGWYGKLQGIGLLCGYLGVELFFVLSGFLIGGILIAGFEKDASLSGLWHFWLRRWFRTIPNYFLFLVINILLLVALGQAVPPVWRYFVFLQNFVAPPPAFFVESWSLAVEEWFYLVLPIGLFGLVRLLRMPLRMALAFGAIFGILVVTAIRVWYVEANDPPWLLGVRVIASMRLDACMFGVVGAWVCRYYPGFWEHVRRSALLLGLACGVAVIANVFDRSGGFFDMKTTGFTLTSFGALCLLPVLHRWTNANGPIAAATTRLSLWSYSLYLVNLPVFTLCSRFLEPRGVQAMILVAVFFVVVSIAISALVYRFFERPIMELRERVARTKGTSVAALDRARERVTG
jgi:peptidoglycan/LPS O-acetylase OafA/YrhL